MRFLAEDGGYAVVGAFCRVGGSGEVDVEFSDMSGIKRRMRDICLLKATYVYFFLYHFVGDLVEE